MTRLDRPAYSFRDDPAVPDFPDDRPLIVFDGVCVLCSGFARFVLRHDRNEAFLFASAQSPLGQALYRHYGLDPDDFETNLVIDQGVANAKLGTVSVVGRRLGGVWRAAALADWVPEPLSGWLYDLIASNRYRLFGKRETCMVPPADQKDRFYV